TVGGSGSKYTPAGIFKVVAASRWEPAGERHFVEVDGQRRLIRDYRWDEGRMRVQIQTFESSDTAKKRADKAKAPTIGMQIGPHAVALIPRGETDPLMLKDAERILEEYDRLMKEQ
ncbi:MAG: hypothetical protein ABEK29_00790, partial [Bradymonadaceae bacterium]